jgi:LDH2 family malate/lactate/ureidoglycolate dehydrogenase
LPVIKVRTYRLPKKSLAPGWVLDGRGNSVVDSGDAHACIGWAVRTRRPEDMANHKGYGLAIMVQVLAATLCGAAFSPLRAGGATDDIGLFFLALDPSAFRRDGGFLSDIEAMIEVLHTTPPIEPSRPVLIPGQCEPMSRRHRRVHGIPVPEDLADEIKALCSRPAVPFTLIDDQENAR